MPSWFLQVVVAEVKNLWRYLFFQLLIWNLLPFFTTLGVSIKEPLSVAFKQCTHAWHTLLCVHFE